MKVRIATLGKELVVLETIACVMASVAATAAMVVTMRFNYRPMIVEARRIYDRRTAFLGMIGIGAMAVAAGTAGAWVLLG